MPKVTEKYVEGKKNKVLDAALVFGISKIRLSSTKNTGIKRMLNLCI